MRMKRVVLDTTDGDAVYHCIGRVAGQDFLLGEDEREVFVRMLKEQAVFSGVEVISYCVMSNHFHLLLRFSDVSKVTDAQLVARVKRFYGKKSVLRELVVECFESHGKLVPRLRKPLLSRMGDLSKFMQELKGRYTRWYNRTHERKGTLWSERFRSIVVEDAPEVISMIAAYIDLNPVRAGIAEDPKEYRWCSYAEAVVGGKEARRGIVSFSESKNWTGAHNRYRQLLFVKAGVSGRSDKTAVDRETILEVQKKGGSLSMAEVLRLKVRYFSDGVALGSVEHVEKVFGKFRGAFSEKRKKGARRMRLKIGDSPARLCTLRDLQKDSVC